VPVPGSMRGGGTHTRRRVARSPDRPGPCGSRVFFEPDCPHARVGRLGAEHTPPRGTSRSRRWTRTWPAAAGSTPPWTRVAHGRMSETNEAAISLASNPRNQPMYVSLTPRRDAGPIKEHGLTAWAQNIHVPFVWMYNCEFLNIFNDFPKINSCFKLY
jgi:hypothetical protein